MTWSYPDVARGSLVDGEMAGRAEPDLGVEAVGALVGGTDHDLDLAGAPLGQAEQDAVRERAARTAGAVGGSDGDGEQLGVRQRAELGGGRGGVPDGLEQAADHARPH